MLAVEPSHSSDERFMLRALELAHEARFWTSPNPHVGCVLVRDGEIIGEGFTQPAGGSHAEVQALAAAGDATGATAYVTLEPCSHHGRTGPCADALIAAGVTRVVAALQDPNPSVAGQGLARLRAAGIAVELGVAEQAARREIQGFLWRMTRGWGRVRLKSACSLDGRTAMASGESQWITGPEARQDVQRLRAESCVVLTGSGTVLADDCRLTVRPDGLALAGTALERATTRKPLRAVLDSHCRIPMSAAVFNDESETLVFHAPAAEPNPNLNTTAVPVNDQGLDLAAVMRHLGERGANEILVEAGPTLAAGLLQAGLVDEWVIYQAPSVLGASARPLTALSLERLADSVRLNYTDISLVGGDLRIIATMRSDAAEN